MGWKKIVFGLLLPSLAQGFVPPAQTWNTLATPHFRIHHTPSTAAFAKEFSQELESALPLLEKNLQWAPDLPIDVLINDRSDDANGLALSFPINRLEVYAVPFSGDSVLGEYTNWIKELAIHELTHIIANDTAKSGYRPLRKIFGSIIKPNGLQPAWIVEGLAVYQETALTDGGRGRSAFTEALFRATDWSQITLDRLNEGPFWWPGGNTPYFYGYLAQTGLGDPGQASSNNASTWPYALNYVARKTSGSDWDLLWKERTEKIKNIYPPLPTPDQPCYLTKAGYFSGGQALAPDGSIYFSLQHPDVGHALAKITNDNCNANSWQILTVKSSGGPEQVAASPNGNRIVYAANSTSETFKDYSEIYLWENNQISALTKNERSSEPTFINNDEILYVKNRGDGFQEIRLLKIKEKSFETIYIGKIFERISSLFYSDGKIYFSRHNNNGQEEILQIPFLPGQLLSETNAKPAIPSQGLGKGKRFFERHPYVDANGDLYFTANYPERRQTSAYSLYVYKKGKLYFLGDSASGMWWRPVVKNNLLYISDYTANGFELRKLKLNEFTPSLFSFEKVFTNNDLHQHLSGQSPRKESTSIENLEHSTQPYSAWSTPASSLWPHYWRPVFSLVADGIHAGAATSGLDPLEFHHYSLMGLYDSRATFPIYEASYFNRRFRTQLYFQSDQTNSYLQSSKRSNRITTHSFQIIYPYESWSFAAGIAAQTRYFLQSKSENAFLFHSTHFSSARKNPSAIDYNHGRDFQLYFAAYPKGRIEKAFVDIRPRFSLFFPGFRPSHSLMLHSRGGITTNRFLASNYYIGGGIDPLSENNFSVRGYPTDSLLGQKMITANLAYTLPLSQIYEGWSIHPFFLKSFGLRFLLDAGTANYLSEYRTNNIFLGYGAHHFGRRWIAGAGTDLVLNSTLLYYIPTEFTFGIHYGFLKQFGGGFTGYLGIKTALDLISGNRKTH